MTSYWKEWAAGDLEPLDQGDMWWVCWHYCLTSLSNSRLEIVSDNWLTARVLRNNHQRASPTDSFGDQEFQDPQPKGLHLIRERLNAHVWTLKPKGRSDVDTNCNNIEYSNHNHFWSVVSQIIPQHCLVNKLLFVGVAQSAMWGVDVASLSGTQCGTLRVLLGPLTHSQQRPQTR